MRRFVRRHQPPHSLPSVIKAGLGSLLGIALVALLGQASGWPLLIAPFGATAVLLFSLPESPLSQPAHVVGGHVLSTLLALLLRAVLPMNWWTVALAVGLAVALMAALRLTHPPAGADPIVVFLGDPGFEFLIVPVLAGSALLVLLAWLIHRLPPRTPYPLPHPEES